VFIKEHTELPIYLIGNHHSCLLYPFKVCESI